MRGRVLVTLLAIALVSAAGAGPYPSDTSTAALASGQSVGERALPYAVGFESPFVPGFVGGQQGWTTFAASTVQPVISTANPAAGSQELRLDNDPAVAAGTYVGGFSPVQGPLGAGQYVVSVDVAISATGGANYIVVPQAPSQSFLTARVEFDWLGDIYVLDDVGSGLALIDTGFAWTPGSYKNLTIDIDSIANTIDYYYDGGLFYSSVAGVFAGTSVEQVVLFCDNYQYGETGDMDNLSVTPEPASLALLALGGLALLRRR